MCVAASSAPAKAVTSAEALVSAVSAIVCGFYDKTVHLLAKREDLEKGSERMRGYKNSAEADELLADLQVESLASKITEKSMLKFRGEIVALQAKLQEAKAHLFLARFCFALFDQFAEFDHIFYIFDETLKQSDKLKDNPFGLGDEPRRLKAQIEKMLEYLTTAKTTALAHKIILSDGQSESLESGVAKLNQMRKEIASRPFLHPAFAGFDLTPFSPNTFYHNLYILHLMRLLDASATSSGKEEEERLDEIARKIGALDPVLRVKIQDKRPQDTKKIEVTSLVLDEAEKEIRELHIKAELLSYKVGLERALSELSEYNPRRTIMPFESSGGAGESRT